MLFLKLCLLNSWRMVHMVTSGIFLYCVVFYSPHPRYNQITKEISDLRSTSDKIGCCSDYHLKKLIDNVFTVDKFDKHYDLQHFLFSLVVSHINFFVDVHIFLYSLLFISCIIICSLNLSLLQIIIQLTLSCLHLSLHL